MKTEVVIFKNNTGNEVTLEDILRRIYENSSERHDQIVATTDHITSKIDSPSDAMMLMPSLIELQKTAIKNDDQLISLAAIVQKSIAAEKKGKGDEKFVLTANDRQLLLERAKELGLPGESNAD